MYSLRHAIRQLLKAPGFTIVAVLTLAIGIGICTAMFSVIDSVLLQPVRYPDSERLVVLHDIQLPQRSQQPVSPANFLEWSRSTEDVFESLYAFHLENFNVTGPGVPTRVHGVRATSEYFETLRSPAMIGRVFDATDVTAGRSRIAVLSHAFWQTQFGGQPDVVGKNILLNGWSLEIIGVMPPDFQRDEPHQVFTPLGLGHDLASLRHSHFLHVGARLKPGISVEAAATRMASVGSHLAEQFPGSNRDWTVSVTSILNDHTSAVRRPLYLTNAAISVLLLIACANLVGLTLVRTNARHRELSVRVALGAGRWRIVRQFLTESLLVALAAGALGLLLGQWALDTFLAFAPADFPRTAEISMDGRAVAGAISVTLLIGLGLGILPALHASRFQPGDALRNSTPHATSSVRDHLIRDGLVVAQIALTLTLLAGAGLLIRSFANLTTFNPGFEPRGAIAIDVAFPWRKYDTAEKQAAVADAVMDRYRMLSGVTRVAATTVLPVTAQQGWKMELESNRSPVDSLPRVNVFSVSTGYFETLGIAHIRGRDFTAADRVDSPPVAIIGRSTAAQYFGDMNPIGRRIRLHEDGPVVWREIVGIAADVKSPARNAESRGQVYVSLAQAPSRFMTFVVRTVQDPAALTSDLRSELLRVDPEQPAARLETLQSMLSSAVAQHRFTTLLTAGFSLAALVLAALGIYALVASSVRQRTREFAIRLALGASHGNVVNLVLTQSARLVVTGIALGLLGAFGTSRLLHSLLFGVSAHDPLTFVVIALLVAAVAGVACFIPARRATQVDPLVALRAE